MTAIRRFPSPPLRADNVPNLYFAITISKQHARQRGAKKADFDVANNDDGNGEGECYEVPYSTIIIPK